MAVAYEATGAGVAHNGNATNSGSFNHTHPGASGPNGCVVAMVAGWRSLGQVVTVTASYGGTPMTALTQYWGNADDGTTSNTGWIQFYYLLNPPTGSRTVTYNYSMTTAPNDLDLCANTVSYTGVASVGTPYGEGGTETGTAMSLSYSSASDRLVLFGFMQEWSTALSAFNGTQRFAISQGGSLNAFMGDMVGASTTTGTATRTSGADYAEMAVDLRPSGGGPGPTVPTSNMLLVM